MEKYDALELNEIKDTVAKYCAFSLGKKRVSALYPQFSSLVVKEELRRTQHAIDLLYRYGTLPFGGISDIGEYVLMASKDATLGAYELYEIAKQGRAVKAAFAYEKESDIEASGVFELIDSLHDVMPLTKEVEACINRNFEVMDHASPTLRNIRRTISQMQGEIASVAQKYIAAHASSLTDTITAIRNDRICVLVKISEKNHLSGFIHGESASHQSAYLEPQCLLELNNRIAEAKEKEQEEVNRILFELSQSVKANQDALLSNLDTFAYLDELYAKAWWAKDHEALTATICEEQHLYLKNARHPLIDEKQVVANTYELKAPYRALLITGSNTGGKTVTLKTIGLFVVMSMCGLAIPCSEARIPMFDEVFVDIGDHQSIVESLSTFSAHIKRLADITKEATSRSLVLLDELGSGTDPKEGEALATAIVECLREKQAMIVATTHFSNLKTYGKNCEDVLIASVAFDMETMKPTYQYMEGISGTSNAFAIAKRYALDEKIIERAQYFKDANRSKEEMVLESIEAQTMQLVHEKEALAKEKEQLKLQLEALETKTMQLNERIKAQEARENTAYETLLEEAYEKVDAIIKEAKALNTQKPHEYHLMKKKLKALEKEEVVESKEDESFAVGDYVKLVTLGYHGEIISMNKDRVCVLCNGMKMNTKTSEITHMKKPNSGKKQVSYTKQISQTFPSECNVIGFYVDEALPIIDKYLDNAILAHREQVRIVHGSGTGALRKGVHQFLKRHPKVESYRLGQEGEGGLGATIVTLKGKK